MTKHKIRAVCGLLLAVPALCAADLELGPASGAPSAISGYPAQVEVMDVSDKGSGPTPAAVGGIAWEEKGDKPCLITVYAKVLDDGKAPWNGLQFSECDGSSGSRKSALFDDNPRYYVNGLQVCTTAKKESSDDRLKGVRVFAAKVSKDGAVTAIENAEARAERTNCKDWHPAIFCPDGEIAGGIKIHYRDEGGKSVISGLALRCHSVQRRIELTPRLDEPPTTAPRVPVQ